jgi:hypothetical protein
VRAIFIPSLLLFAGGCIIPGELTPHTKLADLKLVSVDAVGIRDVPDRSMNIGSQQLWRPMLKINFTTATNLPVFTRAQDRAIDVLAWPCRGQDVQRFKASYVVDPHVYDQFGEVAHDPTPQAARKAAGGTNGTYHFYIAVATGERTGSGIFTPYDLRKQPEDMCFSVYGASSNTMGDWMFTFNSNDTVIPKEAIQTAIESGDRAAHAN